MGELARQPDAPFLPETPLELLTPRPGEGYSWKDKNLVPIACATAGAISWVAYNIGARRPFYAGIHKCFLSGFVCYWLGKKFQDTRLEVLAERDAIYKHYISLHPEDFPPYEKQRYKDLFLPWNPVR